MAHFPALHDFLSIARSLRALTEMHDVLEAASAANPWFTPGMIRQAAEKMMPWFTEENYQLLLENYGDLPAGKGSLGLILAGNIPLVGFHDLLMGWLAGYRMHTKLSSKDPLLVPALLPLLPESFREAIVLGGTPDAHAIDRLIATGSDNSARFFEHAFRDVPSLVRKNRFSAAVLTEEEDEMELAAFADDLLCYAGAGCRNVSNVFVPLGYDFSALNRALAGWDGEVSPAFEAVVRWEKAVARTLNEDLTPHGRLVILSGENLGPTRLGVIRILAYTKDSTWENLLTRGRDMLQCVVGRGMPIGFGQTQSPGLLDFADGADTLRWLLEPQESTW